jgi:Tfp pilus assembly protein PilF
VVTPRPSTTPDRARPSPGYTPRTPSTRPSPTPRTTTRGDDAVRPVGGTITRPTTRYGSDSATRRQPGTTTTRPTTTRTPTAIRRGDDGRTTRRPTTGEARYTPTRPEVTGRPVTGSRPSTTDSARSPRPGSARIGERTTSTSTARDSVRAGATRGSRTPTTGAAVTSRSPRLVPRSDAPRLSGPRSSTSLVAGATGAARRSYGSSHRSHSSYPHRSSLLWGSYWDPWHHRHSYWNNCWSWSPGFGFSWSASLWAPWSYYRTSFWNDCYSTSWYYRWSQPYCASSSYWWYPSTTYCPIYLQVPSSVVVVSEPAPAAEPAAAGGVIVAGGAALPADPRARGLPADDLAAKYVELGRFYFEAGRFAEAADAYARARGYAPDNASLHFELADAAIANGDYHYAAFLIAEAVRLDPTLATADADKRDYYGDETLFDLHMETLERYLASKPYDAQVHLVHGYNLRFSGQPEAAAAAFRRVLEITPENRAAQTFLAAMEGEPAEPKVH